MIEILEFSAEWCEPCSEQAEILTAVRDDWPDLVTLRQVDVEERGHADLKRRFEPQTLPTTVLLEDGEPIKQFNGLTEREQIVAVLENLTTAQSTT